MPLGEEYKEKEYEKREEYEKGKEYKKEHPPKF